MSSDTKERDRKFIREKIVPRKKYKKVLGVIGAVLGAAVLFGGAAGGVFYLLTETLKRDNAEESRPVEAIIIARDDISVGPETAGTDEARTNPGPSEAGEDPKASPETAAGSAAETEAGRSGQTTAPREERTSETAESESGPGGETENPASESASESAGEGETETPETGDASEGESSPEESGSESGDPEGRESESGGESDPEGGENAGTDRETDGTDSPLLLPERAASIQKSTVRVSVFETGAADWFSASIRQKRELYGVIVAENSEYVLILTQGSGFEVPGTAVTVQVDGVSCSAEFQKGDSISGLAVLRARKAALRDHYEVLPLGNSLSVSVADPVWFSGFSPAAGNGLNEGFISYIEDYRPTVDGYVQKISTGMLHYPGEQGILLNGENELVGIVSDASCTEGVILTAWGISPLKYLLEDMCSGSATAYLGIRCVDVAADEAEALGIPAGLYVQEVTPDSPAYDAGLLPGDRVVRVDAGSVNTNHMLLLWMDIVEPWEEITIGLERRGPDGYEPLEIQLVPGERK